MSVDSYVIRQIVREEVARALREFFGPERVGTLEVAVVEYPYDYMLDGVSARNCATGEIVLADTVRHLLPPIQSSEICRSGEGPSPSPKDLQGT